MTYGTPPDDTSPVIELEAQEAALGTLKAVPIPRADGEPQMVTIRIPPGIGDNGLLRLAGQGAPGPAGGPNGDLLVRVRVKSSPSPASPQRRSPAEIRRRALIVALLLTPVLVCAGIGLANSSEQTNTSDSSYASTPTPAYTPTTYVTPTYASPVPLPSRQLNNGVLITAPAGGPGVLNITNGGSLDAAIFLVPAGSLRSALAVYVRGTSSSTVHNIPDGTYKIYVISGQDWDSATNTFTLYADRFVFDNLAEFTSDRSHYTEESITITPVAGGNATTHQVGSTEFPAG